MFFENSTGHKNIIQKELLESKIAQIIPRVDKK